MVQLQTANGIRIFPDVVTIWLKCSYEPQADSSFIRKVLELQKNYTKFKLGLVSANKISFIAHSRFMELKMKVCSLVAGIFAVSILSVFAQPATVTVTNYATVTITNYVTVTVTVTNMVTVTNTPPAPAASSAVTPAVAAIAAGAPPAPTIKPRFLAESNISRPE